jgi:signal peptidase I
MFQERNATASRNGLTSRRTGSVPRESRLHTRESAGDTAGFLCLNAGTVLSLNGSTNDLKQESDRQSNGESHGESLSGSAGERAGPSPADANVVVRRRRRWLAAILGLFLPGMGYLMAGRTLVGVALALSVPVVPLLVLAAGILGTPTGAVIYVVSLAAIVVVPAIHVVLMRRWTATIRSRGRTALRYAAFIALVLFAQLALSNWAKAVAGETCVRAVRNEGQSMLPTLLPGDRLVVNACRPVTVRPGHLALFALPHKPSARMIKRVVAMGGDTVQITETAILVNSRVFMTFESPASPNQIIGPLLVPPDSLYVVGDYLRNSADSRHFGAVPSSHVLGYAVYVLYSPAGGLGRLFQSLTP